MFVDPKSIFLAFLMLLEPTKKVSEQRLVEKKVYASLKIDNNFKIFPQKRFAISQKRQFDETFLSIWRLCYFNSIFLSEIE